MRLTPHVVGDLSIEEANQFFGNHVLEYYVIFFLIFNIYLDKIFGTMNTKISNNITLLINRLSGT